jgi:hypothetical protein
MGTSRLHVATVKTTGTVFRLKAVAELCAKDNLHSENASGKTQFKILRQKIA